MKYIKCSGFGGTYIPAYVIGEYLRKYTKTKFFLYVSTGEKSYKKEPFYNYARRTDYRTSKNNYDFISLVDLGNEFHHNSYSIDECEHLVDFHKICPYWWTNELVAEIVVNTPENFLHHLKVYDIPKGTKFRCVEYDGAESIEFEHDIEWEIAT